MAKRGRPSTQKNSGTKRVTIVFQDNDTLIIDRIINIATENHKSISDIIKNILKIGIDCYDLGFNIGFDGQLIKSEVNIKLSNNIQKNDEFSKEKNIVTKDNNKTESVFME